MRTIKVGDSKFDTPTTQIDTTATLQKGQLFKVVLMPPQNWPNTTESNWGKMWL
jgi:hypothetical protein